jgi:hypothetical protein
MPCILDFTNPYQLTAELPPKRYNLRLILWAGDGEHDGVTDVRRLRNYDVYVCLGLRADVLKRNMDDLTATQILCMIDMRNQNQLALFRNVFQDCFSVIDADYFGNTPTLPLTVYSPLLGVGGIAYNTEGINGLVMLQDNFLSLLEIFAPVLDERAREMRRWDKMIIDLAKRDDISPGEVWSSADLKHAWYDTHREAQERFQGWQKDRNPGWPWFKPTIEDQCDDLSPRILCAPINENSAAPQILNQIRPHLIIFEEYLSQKVQHLSTANLQIAFRHADGIRDFDYELDKMDNTYKRIRFYQNALKWLTQPIPAGLVGEFGYYADVRQVDQPIVFGLYYRKE